MWTSLAPLFLPLFWSYNLKLVVLFHRIRYSPTVRISRFHREGRGSIPRTGENFYTSWTIRCVGLEVFTIESRFIFCKVLLTAPQHKDGSRSLTTIIYRIIEFGLRSCSRTPNPTVDAKKSEDLSFRGQGVSKQQDHDCWSSTRRTSATATCKTRPWRRRTTATATCPRSARRKPASTPTRRHL